MEHQDIPPKNPQSTPPHGPHGPSHAAHTCSARPKPHHHPSKRNCHSSKLLAASWLKGRQERFRAISLATSRFQGRQERFRGRWSGCQGERSEYREVWSGCQGEWSGFGENGAEVGATRFGDWRRFSFKEENRIFAPVAKRAAGALYRMTGRQIGQPEGESDSRKAKRTENEQDRWNPENYLTSCMLRNG